MTWRKLWPEFLIFTVAAFLRLWMLDLKPIHFDEGINGWFVDQMWDKGFFSYDPTNYHGPLHFYLLQFFQLIFGVNSIGLRMVTVVFSMATLFVILRHRKYLGRSALWAGAAFAISPAMVFYARYAIHETELVFFLVLMNYGLLKWMNEKNNRALIIMAISVVGCLVTKETWLIHFAVLLIALAMLPLLRKFFPEQELVDETPPTARPGYVDRNFLLILLGVSSLAVFALYSGFFNEPYGMINFFKAYAPWLKTGTHGNGHEKPWYYWVALMWRYETLSLVGFFLCAVLLPKTSRAMRLIGLVGMGTCVAYSLVYYKTPWCIVSFLWAFLFGFGYALELVLRAPRVIRTFALVVTFSLGTYTFYRSVDINFYHYDLESEPYVYVSSFRELNQWLDDMDHAREQKPSIGNVRIQVCLNSYWPLPWLLRDWPGAIFTGSRCVDSLIEDVVLIDQSADANLSTRLKGEYFKKRYRFRGSQEDFFVYFKRDVFESLGVAP